MYGNTTKTQLACLTTKTSAGTVLKNCNKTESVFSTSRTGTKTPGYFKLLEAARGLPVRLPFNNYSYTESETKYPFGWGRLSHDNVWTEYRGQLYGTWGPSYPGQMISFTVGEKAAINSMAVTKLRNKLKGDGPNLVQAFAERKATIRTIGSAATAIARSIKSLKRGRLGDAAEALGVTVSKRAKKRYERRLASVTQPTRKGDPVPLDSHLREYNDVLSSGILAVQYGWRPLISDVYKTVEMLSEIPSNEIVNVARSKTERMKSVLLKDQAAHPQSGQTSLDLAECTYSVKYVCMFKETNSSNHTLAEVGVTNPASIVWELTPWSFVIDWFVPVGNYLSSLDATLGLTFVGGSKTEVNEWKTIREVNWSHKFFSGNYYDGQSNSSNRSFTVTRTKLTTFPSAVLPSFKNPLSLEHALNGIALLLKLRK